MIPELLELDQIRIDEDLPYEVLAGRVGIPHSVLVRTLRQTTTPRDRTLHKIRRFLASRPKPKPARRAK